jgi:hypothetical protein
MNFKHIMKYNINKYTGIHTKQIRDIELRQYRVAVLVITTTCCSSSCYVISCFAARCTQSHRLRLWYDEQASQLRNAWWRSTYPLPHAQQIALRTSHCRTHIYLLSTKIESQINRFVTCAHYPGFSVVSGLRIGDD